MSEPDPEDDLKTVFARQRAADHNRAPSFHAMRSRALATGTAASAPLWPAWRWAMAGAVAAGVAIAAIFLPFHHGKTPDRSRETLARELEQIDAALQQNLAAHDLTAWQSPTDFLLNSH